MIVRYYGHSLFTFTLESGTVLLTDPYGAFYGYPQRTLHADVVTVSHHHHDHDSLAMVSGKPVVIDLAGAHSPAPGVKVTGTPTWHDGEGGSKRGGNLVFVIEAEGLRIAHLGDLGHVLAERQRAAIGPVDVALVPVGGLYTTDAAVAAQNVRLLAPRLTIPMHYRTPYDPDMPIETEAPFLALMGVKCEPLPLLRLTAGDLGERPAVLLLAVTDPDGPRA